jgi:hypothetical protein
MSTKAIDKKDQKGTSSNRSKAATQSQSRNGKAPKLNKKSLHERWIEKYGVDDSEAAKATLRAWKKTYENREKFIK